MRNGIRFWENMPNKDIIENNDVFMLGDSRNPDYPKHVTVEQLKIAIGSEGIELPSTNGPAIVKNGKIELDSITMFSRYFEAWGNSPKWIDANPGNFQMFSSPQSSPHIQINPGNFQLRTGMPGVMYEDTYFQANQNNFVVKNSLAGNGMYGFIEAHDNYFKIRTLDVQNNSVDMLSFDGSTGFRLLKKSIDGIPYTFLSIDNGIISGSMHDNQSGRSLDFFTAIQGGIYGRGYTGSSDSYFFNARFGKLEIGGWIEPNINFPAGFLYKELELSNANESNNYYGGLNLSTGKGEWGVFDYLKINPSYECNNQFELGIFDHTDTQYPEGFGMTLMSYSNNSLDGFNLNRRIREYGVFNMLNIRDGNILLNKYIDGYGSYTSAIIGYEQFYISSKHIDGYGSFSRAIINDENFYIGGIENNEQYTAFVVSHYTEQVKYLAANDIVQKNEGNNTIVTYLYASRNYAYLEMWDDTNEKAYKSLEVNKEITRIGSDRLVFNIQPDDYGNILNENQLELTFDDENIYLNFNHPTLGVKQAKILFT